MLTPPKVTIIILNHNSFQKFGAKALEYLQSIISTDYPNLEVVIVDNGSIDGSIEAFEKFVTTFNNVKVVRLGRNTGCAAGRNAGAKATSNDSKYIAMVDDDVFVEKDWLRKIVQIMESDENIGAAQPKIMQLHNPNVIDCLGGKIDIIGRSYEIGNGLNDLAHLEKPYQIFFAKGAAAVYRRGVFEKLGGFDEDYFIYYEETDLCWRLLLNGFKVVAVPTSKIYHVGGDKTSRISLRTIYLSRRNQLTTLIKNYSAKNAVVHATQLTINYMSTAILRAIKFKDPAISYILLAAIIYNLRNLNKVLQKRMKIQKHRKISDKLLMRHMLTRQRYNQLTRHRPKSY